jgi:hypothetical protein
LVRVVVPAQLNYEGQHHDHRRHYLADVGKVFEHL